MSVEMVMKCVDNAAAWRGPDLEPEDWLYHLDGAESEAIAATLADIKSRDLSLAQIEPATVAVPAMSQAIHDWLHRLEDGLGFVIIRGLDVSALSASDAALVYYALGRQMGYPVSQNANGHLIAHVRDTGRKFGSDTNVRGYQTSIPLPFHTDTSTDVLGLLCYRTAKEGGTSHLASLVTIYNEILATRPDLIDVFYQPFNFDCRDEEHPDGGPFYTRVLASVTAGTLSLRHNSGYARSSARFDDCPPLTERQEELLALVDSLATDPAFHFSTKLERGDILLVNNYAVMHSRSRFTDHEQGELKRHLLRLWLVLYEGRPLASDFDNRAGLLQTTGPGDLGLNGP